MQIIKEKLRNFKEASNDVDLDVNVEDTMYTRMQVKIMT
jgi:hypothetical protein